MNWLIYFAGVVTLPVLAGIAAVLYALLSPTRRWLGCGSCGFWTTSLIPVVCWLQWQRHNIWKRLAPKAHAAYAATHPPRAHHEESYIATDELLGNGLSQDVAQEGAPDDHADD